MPFFRWKTPLSHPFCDLVPVCAVRPQSRCEFFTYVLLIQLLNVPWSKFGLSVWFVLWSYINNSGILYRPLFFFYFLGSSSVPNTLFSMWFLLDPTALVPSIMRRKEGSISVKYVVLARFVPFILSCLNKIVKRFRSMVFWFFILNDGLRLTEVYFEWLCPQCMLFLYQTFSLCWCVLLDVRVIVHCVLVRFLSMSNSMPLFFFIILTPRKRISPFDFFSIVNSMFGCHLFIPLFYNCHPHIVANL